MNLDNIDFDSIPGIIDSLLEIAQGLGAVITQFLQPILGEWTTVALLALGFGISYGLKDQLRNGAFILGGIAFFLILYRPI